MNDEMLDRLAIRELLQNWVLWRDAGDWDRFQTVWHDDGVMMATWFQGPARDFIRVSQEGWDKGVSILHFLGGTAIDLAGTRAIAQTRMTVSQRATVEGVLCDIVCTGRFYDFVEKREGRWASSCASRSTKRTGWTRCRKAPCRCSTGRRLPAFPKAIGTWRMRRRRSATP